MKSKLRFVAASLALLIGISGAAFAQPSEHNRNNRGDAAYRGNTNTSAWSYQNGRQDQDDRAYRGTYGDRNDMRYQVRRDDNWRYGYRQMNNGWQYGRDSRDQRGMQNRGRGYGNYSAFHRNGSGDDR